MSANPVMALLADGVPLSLLIDLSWPEGPPSREIYAWEHLDILLTEHTRQHDEQHAAAHAADLVAHAG